MTNRFARGLAFGALAFACAAAAGAQTPPAAPAAADATVVAKPTYVSIPMEIMVDRPAADVWKRIGKYCDIGEWFRIPCTITQGTDGEFGGGAIGRQRECWWA